MVEGKTVLVTGANRGIGKALVSAFLQHGAKKIYAAARNPESLDATAGGDDGVGAGVVFPLYIDLSKPETIEAAAEQSNDVDIVVNNAGVLSRTGPLDDDAASILKREMDVNVYGLLAMAKHYAPILRQNGGKRDGGGPRARGALVQVNSVASFRCPARDIATYSATKAAAYSLTQALREELAGDVRVISVHPGPINTDMIRDAGPEFRRMAEDPSRVAEEVIRTLDEVDGDNETFHVFPDSKSKQLQKVLNPYLKTVIEEGNPYG